MAVSIAADAERGEGERMQTKGSDAMFDPICGRRVDPTARFTFEFRKHTYFFCSAPCKERFERQAEKHRVKDLARMGALFAKNRVRWGLP